MLIKTSFADLSPVQLDQQIIDNKWMFEQFGYSNLEILIDTRYYERFESLELDQLSKEEITLVDRIIEENRLNSK